MRFGFSQILQFVITGIASGGIYALIALGFTLIYTSTNIINFAQGEFVVLGGLVAFSLLSLKILPLPVVFLVAVVIVTLVGVVFERLVIFPLKDASIISLIIATVGVSFFLKASAMIIWGREALTFPHFFGEKPIKLLGAYLIPQYLFITILTIGLVVLLQLFFRSTALGKAMRATAINKTAAQLAGINTSRMVLYSFALSAALGAVAGISTAPIAMMSYASGAEFGIKGFAAAILGGIGNPLGAVLGGFVLGITESVGAGVISSGYKDAIALIILLGALLLKPSGIFEKVGLKR
ncbi:MAG: branched-chain amino acid ABC transporter permease [Actinomycetota bacterium]